MANILMVAGRVLCILFIAVLGILVWKTAEYFNTLPKEDKNAPLLAWDALMLFLMMIYLAVRLVVV